MTMAQVCGFVICLFVGLMALTILYLIWTRQINLKMLLSEANGDASMSRFQLLIFIFVIAIGLFEIIEKSGAFPDIPTGVLTLLGISASTYAVGKGISYSQPDVMLNTGSAGGDGNTDAAQAATDTARALADDAKAHSEAAQKAAQQAAGSATQAKQAADQATASKPGNE